MADNLTRVALFGVIGLILAASIILAVQFIPILEEPPIAEAGGMLIINVTDAPAEELEELFLRIDEVLVHKAGGDETWMDIAVMETEPFDLLLLVDTSMNLAVGDIPTGKYTEIRIHVDNANATIDGVEELPLSIVANGWLKVKVHFTIEEASVTSVTVDIEVNPEPIVNARILHPVVKADVKYVLVPETHVRATLEQNYYLWAENDTVDPTPFASENTSISDVALTGAVLRLRLSIRNIGTAAWSAVQLKAQYSINQMDWDDVGTGEWLYSDGLGDDGVQIGIGGLLLTGSTVPEHFVESALTVTIIDIPVDGQGEWDICIESDGAISGETYYFRLVLSDGTSLDVYSEYPTLKTVT
ncbi:MAG: DUF4382 domain-containing protein [Candidatus Bathyarchaeota archaeon]|nr:DUF4382 domain-containing protein [Candidatus Bathyarchaeota archaeon]